MVRCEDFYKKWEECGNFCEKHPDTAQKIDKYLDFIHEIESRKDLEPEVKKTMVDMSERALRPLIKEKDPMVKEKVIQSIKKSVKTGKHPINGQFTKKKKPNPLQTSKWENQKPQLPKTLPEIKITNKDVEKLIRKEKETNKETRRKEVVEKLPEDKYTVIIADPPWKYQDNITTPNRVAENEYPTMSWKDIMKMEIPAAKDSILYLWTTPPKVEEAVEVLNAWGFTYKTCMVWIKDKIGMGYYARNKHELILIGTRGKGMVPVASKRPNSVFYAPRQEHSRKPDYLHELLEEILPGERYLELFARRPRPGWKVWGDQV